MLETDRRLRGTMVRMKELSLSRLFFLITLSLLLNFGAMMIHVHPVLAGLGLILAVFSPLPLILGIYEYGRFRSYLSIAFYVLAVLGLGAMGAGVSVTFLLQYLLVVSFAAVLAESLLRKISPNQAILWGGFLILACVGIFYSLILLFTDFNLYGAILENVKLFSAQALQQKDVILKESGEAAIYYIGLLERPEELAKLILQGLPVIFFKSVFFILWINLLLCLRFLRFNWGILKYGYTEANLLNFIVPSNFLYLFIFGLTLAVIGSFNLVDGLISSEVNSTFEILGLSIIQSLSIFYFFTGFGILIDFLEVIGVRGFFRSMLIALTVFPLFNLIVAAGLFDFWFDFKLKLNNKLKGSDK